MSPMKTEQNQQGPSTRDGLLGYEAGKVQEDVHPSSFRLKIMIQE